MQPTFRKGLVWIGSGAVAMALSLAPAYAGQSDQMPQNQGGYPSTQQPGQMGQQQPGMPTAQTDAQIQQQVQQAISSDQQLQAAGVSASVMNGKVTLNGNVTDPALKQHAENLASSVAGVSQVENDISVNSAAATPASPAAGQTTGEQQPGMQGDLNSRINQALLNDPELSKYAITANVDEKGHVTLNGTVPSKDLKKHANETVKNVAGVEKVKNEIAVNPSVTPMEGQRPSAQPSEQQPPAQATPEQQQPGQEQQAQPPAEQQPGQEQQAQPPTEQQPGQQPEAQPPAETTPEQQPQQQQQPGMEQQPGQEQQAQPPAEQQPGQEQQAQPPAEQQPGQQPEAQPPAETTPEQQQPGQEQQAQPPAEQQPGQEQQAQPPAEQQPGQEQQAQPPAGQPSGSMLQSQVENALKADPALSGVSASVSGNTVTLSGSVASDADKAAAERAVLEVSPTSTIQDQIQVSQPSQPPSGPGEATPPRI